MSIMAVENIIGTYLEAAIHTYVFIPRKFILWFIYIISRYLLQYCTCTLYCAQKHLVYVCISPKREAKIFRKESFMVLLSVVQ